MNHSSCQQAPDNNMQFPQRDDPAAQVQGVRTSDAEELAALQTGKNRRYTQLQAGSFSAEFTGAQLGGVQLIREQLTTGLLLEATPAANYLPFAMLMSHGDNLRFCGQKVAPNSLLQATGGEWDIRFNDKLDYVATIFDRDAFCLGVEQLTGRPAPAEWLSSTPRPSLQQGLNQFQHWVATTLAQLECQPDAFKNTSGLRLLEATALQFLTQILSSSEPLTDKPLPPTRRFRGVRRVLDYLESYAAHLPTIPELCAVAELSERSLEYGFREQLGVTPVRYLKLTRLNGARRDLTSATTPASVSEIALRWGFMELGRFSGEYQRLFGELPSATLRRHT